MKKIHNQLRSLYNWYHNWHNFEYHTHIHFLVFLIFCLFIIGLISSQLFPSFQYPKKDYKILAQTGTKSFTTQADWQAGNYNSGQLDLTTSSGKMQLGDYEAINLEAIYNQDNSRVTVSANDSEKAKAIDNQSSTYWYASGITGPCPIENPFCGGVWTIDLTQQYAITKIRALAFGDNNPWMHIYFITSDDSTFASYNNFNSSCVNPPGDFLGGTQWHECSDSQLDRYLRVHIDNTDMLNPGEGRIYDLEAFSTPLQATHTSAPSQIGDTGDAARYVVQYQTFTPTESEPANSDITYRFRKTNSDGSWTGTWTGYVDYTGTAIDLTSYPELTITQDDVDNNRTYLQIETKFERTDTSANPTLSDYTIQYHTNQPPNTPVPQ